MGSFSERTIIFIALIFLLVFVMLSLLVLVVPRGNTPDELIPFSLASALTADYGADDRSQLVAPVSLQILKDIYRDSHPDASEQEISEWFATSSTAVNGPLSSPGPINGSNDPSPTAAQPDPTQSTVTSTISATPLKSVTTTITPTTSLINTLVATNNPLQTVTSASTLLPTLNFTVTLPLTLTLITPTNTPAPTNTSIPPTNPPAPTTTSVPPTNPPSTSTSVPPTNPPPPATDQGLICYLLQIIVPCP